MDHGSESCAVHGRRPVSASCRPNDRKRAGAGSIVERPRPLVLPVLLVFGHL